jgi:hypothetical protein
VVKVSRFVVVVVVVELGMGSSAGRGGLTSGDRSPPSVALMISWRSSWMVIFLSFYLDWARVEGFLSVLFSLLEIERGGFRSEYRTLFLDSAVDLNFISIYNLRAKPLISFDAIVLDWPIS